MENEERGQTLITLMTKGYIEPALFTKENNDIETKAKALAEEKDRLIKTMAGDTRKMDELRRLLEYVDKADGIPVTDSTVSTNSPETEENVAAANSIVCIDFFDEDLVRQFVDHATVHSREEITFHLKCRLNLRERM